MNEVITRVANNIRKLRKQSGITQKEAAKRAGVSITYWHKVEKADYKPSVKVLVKMAEVLDVDIVKLFEV